MTLEEMADAVLVYESEGVKGALRGALRYDILTVLRAAVAEEREACAAVPEDHLRVCNLTAEHEAGNPPRTCHWHCHKAIAAAIRART